MLNYQIIESPDGHIQLGTFNTNNDDLNKKHIIVIHREIKSEDHIDKYLNIIEKRIYGRSEIFFGRFF